MTLKNPQRVKLVKKKIGFFYVDGKAMESSIWKLEDCCSSDMLA